MGIFEFTLDQYDDAAGLFAHIHHYPYSLWLDSADAKHPDSRYSFVAAFPVETIEGKGVRYVMTSKEGQMCIEDVDPFELVRARMRYWRLDLQGLEGGAPFQGGAAGFFGYDIGRRLEVLPDIAEDDPSMPDMTIGIYDCVYAFDHTKKKGILYVQAEDAPAAEIRKAHYLKMVEQGAGKATAPMSRNRKAAAFTPQWRSNFDEDGYKALVEKTVDYIRAGDIFQANVSQRFDADLPKNFDSFAHYQTLRAVNPAPFASYFNMGNIVIASASPERFLVVDGIAVQTKPIKGTRPRVADNPVLDHLYRNSLENSEKDRSENVMIVDLLRNDLSKVCRPDRVKVSALCALESFARVHHLVSTITGELRYGYDALDLLRACFPGGSITGAPKIRAMEIIETLEPTRRGPYCGSMGYIGFDGNMDTNILIRTLVYHDSGVSFQVGGGIVVDSDPAAEYEETLVKARGLFDSFDAFRNKGAEAA